MAYSIAFSFCVITGWNIFTTQHAATGRQRLEMGTSGAGNGYVSIRGSGIDTYSYGTANGEKYHAATARTRVLK
jgi:hypothetical protein